MKHIIKILIFIIVFVILTMFFSPSFSKVSIDNIAVVVAIGMNVFRFKHSKQYKSFISIY